MKINALGKARTFKFLFRIVLPVLVISASCVGLEGCAPPCYEVDFYPSNDTIVEGGSIVFTDNTLAEGESYYWTYAWTFNGGTPASANTVGPHTVVYTTPGVYSVNLTISGCDGDLEKTIQITVAALPGPGVQFVASATTIDEGDAVTFTDQSTGTPTSWLWTFEGGSPSSSTDQNPTGIMYATEGVYDVTLEATNADGSDTLMKTDYITVNPPAPYCSPVTDIDGNMYEVVEIGSHCWMTENLKTSKYRNGTSITTGLDNTAWENNTIGAYKYYDNSSSNNTTYGKLYNWYAINNSNGICPDGWHVATDANWADLYSTWGGISVANPKIRASTGWSPNSGNNSSGFTALPGGLFGTNGQYGGLGDQAYFWSATQNDATSAFTAQLYNGLDEVFDYPVDKNAGMSCRCVKD